MRPLLLLKRGLFAQAISLEGNGTPLWLSSTQSEWIGFPLTFPNLLSSVAWAANAHILISNNSGCWKMCPGAKRDWVCFLQDLVWRGLLTRELLKGIILGHFLPSIFAELMSFESKKEGNSWIKAETETCRESIAAGVEPVIDGRHKTPPRELPGLFLSVI